MVVEIEILLKLLLAAALGSLVGLERELHKKPAGLRTHAMVALGACLFTIAGADLIGNGESLSRVLQGVITGIGFLGAGIIFQAKDRVKGLTTAAEIWSLAAIGILVGTGNFATATIATAFILIILVPFKWFERGWKNN
jgi:putative Mg2+ transporter-C (MgtC) family protein